MKRYKKVLSFIILLILVAALIGGISSCKLFLSNAEKVTSAVSFNYPGLRVETRNISFHEIENNFPRVVCSGDSVTLGWNISYDNSYPVLL
jgi:hypothetical protein